MDEITSGSVEELRGAIARGWTEFSAAISASESRWEETVLQPEGPFRAGGSEESWSPRRAAWHALIVERFRRRYIEERLRAGEEQVAPSSSEFWERYVTASVREAAEAEYEQAATPQAVVALVREEHADHDRLLDAMTDEDLDRPAGLSEGQQDYVRSHGQATPERLRGQLLIAATHLMDHAAQIRSASSQEG